MSTEDYNQELVDLLSAYLDNELTELQIEKVEKLIEQDQYAHDLLDELKAASCKISQLPHEEVPRDLTDEVLYILERDTLLDGDDVSVMAGERHLRMRNFVGFAAILVLVGAVFWVVYSILTPGEMKTDTQYLAMSDEVKDTKVKSVESQDDGIVRFSSIKDAAEFLSQGSGQNETAKATSSDAVAKIVINEPLPQLPPMKKFEAPQAEFGSLKLASAIQQSENVVVERLVNNLRLIGIDTLVSNRSGVYTMALVCKAEDFDQFYVTLRDSLPGSIDLQINDVDDYSLVEVDSVSSEELKEFAVLGRSSDQLAFAIKEIDQARLELVKKVVEPPAPLWQQIAGILPEQYQEKFGDSLKSLIEPFELDVVDEDIFVSAAAELVEDISVLSKKRSAPVKKLSTTAPKGGDVEKVSVLSRAVTNVEPVSIDKSEANEDSEKPASTEVVKSVLVANDTEPSLAAGVDKQDKLQLAVKAPEVSNETKSKHISEFIAIEIVIKTYKNELENNAEPTEPEAEPVVPQSLETRIDLGF